MAKNINKKQRNGAVSMDVTEPSAIDTSESGSQKPAFRSHNLKTNGRPMKRSKNVRKKKAIGKAISKHEQSVEKVKKKESKSLITQSAKTLYD